MCVAATNISDSLYCSNSVYSNRDVARYGALVRRESADPRRPDCYFTQASVVRLRHWLRSTAFRPVESGGQALVLELLKQRLVLEVEHVRSGGLMHSCNLAFKWRTAQHECENVPLVPVPRRPRGEHAGKQLSERWGGMVRSHGPAGAAGRSIFIDFTGGRPGSRSSVESIV